MYAEHHVAYIEKRDNVLTVRELKSDGWNAG
jgi:hypothetical protein